jgi:replicative DNA helicase
MASYSTMTPRAGRTRLACLEGLSALKLLDEALGGFLANGLHILQAGPGSGKTALALQMCSDCRFPALFVTVEMPLLELFRRLVARQTGTFLQRLKTGELSSAEIRKLAQLTAERLPLVAIMDGTKGYAAPRLILETAKGMREKARADNVLVVIDSLQTWARSSGNEGSEYDLVSVHAQSAEKIAAHLAAPVVTISHRNRQSNKSGGGLYGGKGSGDIEYLAESVIDLERDLKTKDGANGEIPVSVTIWKNRHGMAGTSFDVRFCGRLQSFKDGG